MENYALLRAGIEVSGAVVRVQYGLNMASQLSGSVDPLTGETYEFNPDVSNKYEAILTFDGDLTASGLQPLEDASYTIQALAAVSGYRSGLRDATGNTLYRTGLLPTGDDFSASFVVQIEEPEPTEDPDPPAETDGQATPVDTDAILVNQEYSELQYTTAGQSLAVDNDGDFVVAWTRYDDVDSSGNPTDANIYARYFTDEVQRLTLLPSQLAEDNDGLASTLGSFTLEYAAPEIQMLSITAGHPALHQRRPRHRRGTKSDESPVPSCSATTSPATARSATTRGSPKPSPSVRSPKTQWRITRQPSRPPSAPSAANSPA